MTATTYPTTLPGPSVAPVTAAERRLIAQRDGVRNSRAGQRDRLAMQDVTFNFLTFAECEVFRAWWVDVLHDGGAWFTSTWPLPQGWISAVRRFTGAPRWDYIPAAGWRSLWPDAMHAQATRPRGRARGRATAPI